MPLLKQAIAPALARLWPTFPVRFNQDAAFMSRDPEAAKVFLNDSSYTARFGAEFLAAIKRVQSSAADLAVPLLILHGTRDQLARPEGSSLFVQRVALADKELRLYEDGRHCLYWDINRQEVLADVVEWLERHLPL